MENKIFEMSDVLTTLLTAFIISVSIFFFLFITGVFAGESSYEKNYMNEDAQVFGNYNNNYEDSTNDKSRKIILEFDEYHSKKANQAVVNYISNVNGSIESVNDKQVSKSTINPIVFPMAGRDGGISPKVGFAVGSEASNKTRFILRVPNDAKFADNLQERIDNYLKNTK